MAIKGLTTPIVGKYSAVENKVTYSDPIVANKAVSYSVSFEKGDNNPDYADNGIAENDKGTFTSGEIELSTSDLPQELSMLLLGTGTVTDTFTPVGGEPITATVQVFDDQAKAPYLGFGIIETHQMNDVDMYRAIFLNKVFFDIPENAAETKGESIEWQHPTITGTIQRSDEVSDKRKHPAMEDAWFDSEGKAVAWLKYRCGEKAQGQE